MIEKHHIQVSGVEMIKQGSNKNGPWHLYKVSTPAHKYSTFLEGLQIGQEYDVLVENKPYKGKMDGKMHDGWQITGFDNVAYEQRHERPAVAQAQPIPPTQILKDQSFTEADRQEIKNIGKVVQAIYTYLSGGEPK